MAVYAGGERQAEGGERRISLRLLICGVVCLGMGAEEFDCSRMSQGLFADSEF